MALIGAIIIGVGVVQIYQALSRNFNRLFQPYRLTGRQRIWIDRVGRFGTAARGVVFSLIGVFLFLAAYQHDASRAQGISGVLTVLLHQPYGPWLLGVVAAGLMAFGVYSGMCGVWLRLQR